MLVEGIPDSSGLEAGVAVGVDVVAWCVVDKKPGPLNGAVIGAVMTSCVCTSPGSRGSKSQISKARLEDHFSKIMRLKPTTIVTQPCQQQQKR